MAIGTYYQALNESKPWNIGKKPAGQSNDWQDIIGTMPSLTGSQETVSSPMSEYISGILSGQPSAGQQAMQGNYADALENYYQDAIYKPAMTELQQDIIPAVKESYVATGAITGTEVADKIAKVTTQTQQNLAAQKATLAYQDYLARNPSTSDILNAALAYLNIPMMAAYQKPTDQTGKPVSGGGGGWGASINFNGATGSKPQTPVANSEPSIIGGGQDYWEGQHPTIGEVIASMGSYAGPTSSFNKNNNSIYSSGW